MGCGASTAPDNHNLIQMTDHRTQDTGGTDLRLLIFPSFGFCDASQHWCAVCSAQTDCSPIYLAHIAHSHRVTFETSKSEGQLYECTPLPLILESLNPKSRDILRNVR
eukprot:6875922-Pyramimonas_sp.AAC.1